MKNQELAQIFYNIGVLLEIRGDIIFKIRAYYKAADALKALAEDIEDIKTQGRLSEIPGIGKTLQEKIVEFCETGKLKAYKNLTKEIPESLLEIVKIPSVGPKKAKLFYEECKVKNVAGLLKAIERGKLNGLPGIKEKTIEKIKEGIKIFDDVNSRMNLGAAWKIADQFIAELKKLSEVKKIETSGSLRRGSETIGDIDILIHCTNPKKVMDRFVSLEDVKSINSHGDTKSSVMTAKNVQIDLRIVEPDEFGAALLYFTGSKNFNVSIRQYAIKKKMKVNEYGIFSTKGKKEVKLAGKTEAECFKALGLPNIPPELREDLAGQDLLQLKKTPKLINIKDIKGDLHVHSTWSDGKFSIEDMAKAAKARGLKYLAISDHSIGLRVAGGLSESDVVKKKKEIDQLNKKFKDFRILMGSEVEIDSKGNIDYNVKTLKLFDVVVASIHSGFNQSKEAQTTRYLKVMSNKFVNVIGHPTGIHLGKRNPFELDLKQVCQAAIDHKVALEINAFPIRLDLNSANAYFANQMGVTFSINTDSHHIDHFAHLRHGISVARRAWIKPEKVINTFTLKKLLEFLKK